MFQLVGQFADLPYKPSQIVLDQPLAGLPLARAESLGPLRRLSART
jgi:hypothetical protein